MAQPITIIGILCPKRLLSCQVCPGCICCDNWEAAWAWQSSVLLCMQHNLLHIWPDQVDSNDFSWDVRMLGAVSQSFSKADSHRLLLPKPISLQPDAFYMISALIKVSHEFCRHPCAAECQQPSFLSMSQLSKCCHADVHACCMHAYAGMDIYLDGC